MKADPPISQPIPAREKFRDRLTSPLKDNPEAEFSMRNLLDGHLVAANDGEFERANAILDKHEGLRPGRRLLEKLTPLVLLALVLGLLGWLNFGLARESQLHKRITDWDRDEVFASKWMSEHLKKLSDDERLFLLGDPNESDPIKQRRTLYEKYPDNPAYLVDHWMTVSRGNRSKARNDEEIKLLEKGRVLEPDNAWYPCQIACILAKQAVERNRTLSRSGTRRGSRAGSSKSAPQYTVTDPEKLEEVYKLLAEAAALDKFEDPGARNNRAKVALLPPVVGVDSFVGNIAFRGGLSSAGSLNRLGLVEALNLRIKELSEAGDQDELLHFLHDQFILLKFGNSGETYLINVLLSATTLQSIAKELDSLTSGGKSSPELAAVATEVITKCEDLVAWRNTNVRDFCRNHGGILSSFATGPGEGNEHIPQPTLAELEPERTLWQAGVERVSLHFMVVILFLLAPFFLLVTGPGNKHFRKMATVAAPLMSPWKSLLTGVVATVIAVGYYLLIARLTPLGCADYSLTAYLGMPFVVQILGTFFLLCLLILVLETWQGGRTFSRLGLMPRTGFGIWIPVLLVAVAIPLAGLIRTESPGGKPYQSPWFIAPVILTGIAYIMVAAWAQLLAWFRHEQRVAHLVIGRRMGWSFAAASLVLVALIPLTIWRMNDAARRDTFLSPDHSGLCLSRLERDFTAEYSRRLDAILVKALADLEALEE